tara:strand:- start:69 stop:317 length:249 start_codon:yes stop_codon:yes gene_type:complete
MGSINAEVEIDAGEFFNNGEFCDMVADIVRDTLNSESWVEDKVDEHLADVAEDNNYVDPESDAFVNTVAKALYNMARSYVGT